MGEREKLIEEAKEELRNITVDGTLDATDKIFEIYDRYMYQMYRVGYVEGYDNGVKDGTGVVY